jgi:hypothetical protein
VRLRLEGGFQCSPDPPSRRRLQRLLRMRPRETVGITARDTLCRHGRACPGHPDAVRRSALRIGITGTGPVMTRGCVQCSHFVIDTMYHLGSTLAHPGPTGRAREASQMWGGERSCSRPRTPVGGRPLAALCWSKSKRLTVPRARHPGSSHSTIAIEPGCPAHHPRSTPRLRAPKPWACGCWLSGTLLATFPRLAPVVCPC